MTPAPSRPLVEAFSYKLIPDGVDIFGPDGKRTTKITTPPKAVDAKILEQMARGCNSASEFAARVRNFKPANESTAA